MANIVQLTYGVVTFSHETLAVNQFILLPPFDRRPPSNRWDAVGRADRIPASDYPDINGSMYSKTLKANDGDILLITSALSYRGSPMSQGAILLRVRENGAGLMIRARMPADANPRLGSALPIFVGQGDVLQRDEDIEGEGIALPSRWRSAYRDSSEIGERFVIETVKAHTTATPSFVRETNEKGESVITRESSTAGRRLRYRRS